MLIGSIKYDKMHCTAYLCFLDSGGPACLIFFALPLNSFGEPLREPLSLFLPLPLLLLLRLEVGDLEEDTDRDLDLEV